MGVMKTEQDGAYRAVQPNSEGKLPVVKVWDEASGKYVPVLSVTGGGVELPELTSPGVAADLLKGKELIGEDGAVISGTMPTISPSLSAYSSEGYVVLYARLGKGYCKQQSIEEYVRGSSLDYNLQAQNIANGVTILGVTGTLVGGATGIVRLTNFSANDLLEVCYTNADGNVENVALVSGQTREIVVRENTLLVSTYYDKTTSSYSCSLSPVKTNSEGNMVVVFHKTTKYTTDIILR